MAKEKAKEKVPARLIPDGRFQRCSACQMPFLAESDRSLPEDFANHVKRLHQPGQTSGDVNKPAPRIVRKTTGS
jgi:DNA-binding helix-hairpin-helix protein with protein kinase domain